MADRRYILKISSLSRSLILALAFLCLLPPAISSAQDTPAKQESASETGSIQADLVRLRVEKIKLQRSLEVVEEELSKADDRWAEARAELDSLDEPGPRRRKMVAAFWQKRLALETRSNAIQTRIGYVDKEIEAWRNFQEFLRGDLSRPELEQWRTSLDKNISSIVDEVDLVAARLQEAENELAAEGELLKEDGISGSEAYWQRRYRSNLKERQDALRELKGFLGNVKGSFYKIRNRVEQELDSLPLWRRIAGYSEYFSAIWRFSLTEVEGEAITVGKIFLALFFLVVGIIIAKTISRFIVQKAVRRFIVTAGTSEIIQMLLFYFLVVVITVFSLYLVNVPLTLFTLLGGAIALGLGFGSQNIINNFMSGLILMAERPIKIGDIIEIDQVLGTVEHIGIRSTRLRTPSNFHVVLPNSFLLENRLTNWMLSDSLVRSTVSVGVAYGSPTKKVAEILLGVAENHKGILDSPPPQILFSEFGDSSLLFELRFWIALTTITDRLQLLSDLRFEIDELFRKADITIAFPQRDVHLDTTGTLNVRMIKEEEK